MVVRRLTDDDLRFAAALHRRALPHGFFAGLGLRFLRAYYHTFLASPAACAVVAEADGQRAGVLVGTIDDHHHWRWVVRSRGAPLAALGSLALLSRPRAALRFVRTRARRYLRALVRSLGPSHDDFSASGPAPRPVAVLTHVSVVPHGRGVGIGAALVAAFVREAAAAGVSELQLVTLADDRGAAGFYRGLGWEYVCDRRGLDGTMLSRFRLVLDVSSPA